jgi:hypothetical protein
MVEGEVHLVNFEMALELGVEVVEEKKESEEA